MFIRVVKLIPPMLCIGIVKYSLKLSPYPQLIALRSVKRIRLADKWFRVVAVEIGYHLQSVTESGKQKCLII